MTDLNAIRARLGSLSPQAIAKLPKAVQTLLKDDLPRLIEVAETGLLVIAESKLIILRQQHDGHIPESMSSVVKFGEALQQIAPPTPEQQIKDIPW
jgi:hypothetical protein